MPHREGAATTLRDSGDATTTELAALPMPISAGMILAGKYLVDGLLGAGGMGIVVAARHVHLRHDVAIKFLLPDVAADAETVERFFREAQAASRIKSEHVVRVLDVGTLERRTPYMVMEMLEGRDLAAELQERGALPVQQAVDWVLQAMEALAEAHAAGIVHRDLKPSNLFLTRRADGSPIVKVLDFGLCKDVSGDRSRPALTRSSTGAMGSPLYMAPELVRSAKNATFASDVWSLGVTLHELVTCDVPFGGDTVGAVLSAIMTEPPRPLRSQDPTLPEPLEQAVSRCLVKDPAGRHRGLAELARALEPLASAEGAISVQRIVGTLGDRSRREAPTPRAEAGATTTSLPTREPPPSRVVVLAVGALLGVAVVLVVAVLAMRDRGDVDRHAEPGRAEDEPAAASSVRAVPDVSSSPGATSSSPADAAPAAASAQATPSGSASSPRAAKPARSRPAQPATSHAKPTLDELVERGRR